MLAIAQNEKIIKMEKEIKYEKGNRAIKEF